MDSCRPVPKSRRNCAAVKPSELAPKTQQVVQTIIEETFDSTYISVFTGGAEVGQALLKEDFDHIFFVGSPRVGQYVMRAAAEHLTSVTLELNGRLQLQFFPVKTSAIHNMSVIQEFQQPVKVLFIDDTGIISIFKNIAGIKLLDKWGRPC